MLEQKIIFYQLFEKETSTYTYLLGDPITKEAVLIDPVIEMLERDLSLVNDLGLKLKFVLDTHVHADHISASGEIRKKRSGVKIGLSSAYDMSCADLHIEDNQEIHFGDYTIKAMHTPGHTSGCLSYKLENMIFTGDALLVRGCGRTDFQEGSSEKLFKSVREKLFELPDETIIYPAHDYRGFTKSSIGLEKMFNPRLNLKISKEDFINIMANLKLAHPKKINEAVPANLHCGLSNEAVIINTVEGIPVLNANELQTKLGHVRVIDVRGEDEFNSELGHIQSAELATLGIDLEKKLNAVSPNDKFVFVCRSGKRSSEATKLALSKGIKNVFNLEGGMLKWNELKKPIERDLGGS
jgi:glyoxylase-like metal-dependent hydrolase (beta-lactamase superfamily II)/rhodanese-related sulfurtransferase